MSPQTWQTVQVSILVKALNEEAHIGRCLTAAVREAEAINGEVILVDSLSTDRTVEVASSFPIRIVQFSRREDCGCGAAVQLGYQFAKGEYIYILDGDMELQAGFIAKAMAVLATEPNVAGVAGRLMDVQIRTAADAKRAATIGSLKRRKEVDELGGGGLYRRKAIESVGYLAHRWLPAYEEAELGFRLRTAGWSLVRLPDVAVLHTGHAESSWGMLSRFWKSRRAHAVGMFLRSAYGQTWWWRTARKQWLVFFTPLMHLVAFGIGILLGSDLPSALFAWTMAELAIWGYICLALALKKRNLLLAGFSLVSWHFYTVAALLGAGRTLGDPSEPIIAQELS